MMLPVNKTYQAWKDMRKRCMNPRSSDYHLYGGRGISICERWEKFENFLADMGEAPKGFSLDRFPNNNGNYEPGNCRWATPKEQTLNRQVTRFITFNGITLCVADWEKRLGFGTSTLWLRLKRGMPIDEALTAARGRWK